MANEKRQGPPPNAIQAASYSQALVEHLDETDDINWATDREHVMVHIAGLCDHFVHLARELERAKGEPNSLIGTPLEELYE